MNSSYKGTAAVILGALGLAFAACASSSDSPTGGGSAGQASAGAPGSAGMVGSAGSPGAAGSLVGSTGGSPTAGTAGAATAAGGGYSTGLGGSSTSGGATGTAGAATGTGGAAPMSCGTLTPATGDAKCCVAAGTAADVVIDDFEDGDNVIKPIGQRQGYWYTYGTDKTQVPMPQTLFVPMAGGPAPSLFAGLTMGTVMASTPAVGTTPEVDNEAGIGVGFNNHFKRSCPYNASAYKGITFFAKGSVPIKVVVTMPSTVPPAADGSVAGTCAAMCYDSYAKIIAPLPDNATWTQFTITFADMTTFAQAGFGTKVAFDPSQIMDLQFQIDGAAAGPTPYSFGIDNVSFVP